MDIECDGDCDPIAQSATPIVIETGMVGPVDFILGDGAIPPDISSKADVHESATIGSGVRIDQGVVVRANATIGTNSIVNRFAVIGANCELGENVVVEQKAELGENCYVGNNSFIGKAAILEANVTVGNERRLVRKITLARVRLLATMSNSDRMSRSLLAL